MAAQVLTRVVKARADDGTYTCFFYGTLMNVDILRRVIGQTTTSLSSADAVLRGYCRFHVQQADYPAIVAASCARTVMKRILTDDESSVRGTVVTGLSANDLRLLDIFEGDEYEQAEVEATLLCKLDKSVGDVNPIASQTPGSGNTISALAYSWSAELSRLEPYLWSYEDFLRDKAHRWIGPKVEVDDFVVVDGNRAYADASKPLQAHIINRLAT